MDDTEKTIARSKALQELKDPWNELHKDLTDHILPRKNNIYPDGQRGSRRTSQLFDSTAVYCNGIFAAGLFGGLSNPYQPWFKLGLDDPDLTKFHPVKEWLDIVEKTFYRGFRLSNFYSETHEGFLDMGCVGMPVVYMTRSPKTLFRFSARHISEVCVAENENHEVDTVYRKYPYTVRQAVHKWGGKAGEKARKLAKDKPDTQLTILEAVHPRKDRNPYKIDKSNMPFASLNIILTHEHMIEASGYHEFPFAVPRWSKASNEVYARSPGSNMLSEIFTANNIRKTALKAGHKGVDPPIFLPDEGFTGGKIDLRPGAVNFYRMGKGDVVIPPVSGNVNLATSQLEDSRAAIREGFFTNIFLALLQKTNITATQTMEIVGEKNMVLLGPSLTRIITEYYDPIFARGMGILARDQRIPPPPAELKDREWKVEYISSLAKAQKAYENSGIMETYNFAGLLAQNNPNVMDNLNDDENLRHVADLNNVPIKGLNSVAQVKKMRRARIEAQQDRADIEDAGDLAGIAQTLAKAGKEARV